MADPNTQRQGRSTSRAPKFHIFGMTLDQKELIIAAYCAFFFCVAIIGMIAGGRKGRSAQGASAGANRDPGGR